MKQAAYRVQLQKKNQAKITSSEKLNGFLEYSAKILIERHVLLN